MSKGAHLAEDDSAYVERYVAFLDLLGFSALVSHADDAAVRSIIERLVRHLQDVPSTMRSVKFTQFSDCVVLSTEKNHSGLLIMLSTCKLISEFVMLEGCLVRGGIASGNLLHNDRMVYGSGLLNAYRGDLSGGPPRILLADDIVDAMLHDSGSLSALARRDLQDGRYHLHTLISVEHFDGDEEPVCFPREIWFLPKIVQAMCEGEAVPEQVRAKWNWFRGYWNATVGSKQGRYC